ncbi:Alpha/Beta hydrolase protein [Mariannaea sp. PMI_226]|nr:Alpha/Beta hydrolase protein [Mariannaea sp. PMI_226]
MTTYANAIPQSVEVNGTRYAFLRFGSSAKTEVPLVFLQHFRGTFDHWDPALIDPIARVREVVLLDNSGVGKSSGSVPQTYAEWADNVALVAKVLNIPKIDVLGFSMGGFAAQMVALNYPALVRKLILAGTGPSTGDGIEAGDAKIFQALATASTDQEEYDGFLAGFYSLSPKKQALGDNWWKRMAEARSDRSNYLGPEGTQAQIAAVVRWSDPSFASEASYNRLHEIKIPVLVANGDGDIIIPTVNSWIMFKKLVNAEAHLHLYPDSGHGFLNEYADQFSSLVNSFLEA